MIRRLILTAVFAMLSSAAFAGTILIDSECITLRDIFPSVEINDNIFCGLDYGQEKIINRQMAAYIINKYGIKGANPGEATFRRRGLPLSAEKLKQDIENQLAVMYPELQVEVNTVRLSREWFTPENGQYTIDIPQQRFGNVSVTLDNGSRKTSVSVSVTAYRDLYVTTSPVRKGDEIKNFTTLIRTDLSKVHGEPISSPDGYIAKMNISSGRAVTTNVVDKKPDALKDSGVTIVYQSGGLEISASGILQEDAYEGKIVRVENTSSGKIIRGEYREGRKVVVNSR